MKFLGYHIVRLPDSDQARMADPLDEQLGIPPSVSGLLMRTRNLYRFWWAMHYLIGLSGVIAGALLTALTGSKDGQLSASLEIVHTYSWLVGIIAAVSTSLVTFLGPLHKAERYWSAYHILEQACLEYRSKQGNPKLDRLMQRVMQVRRLLQVAEPDERTLLAEQTMRNPANPPHGVGV